MTDYAHPNSLVSTEWVAQHGSDSNVRLVEVDVDTKAYDEGHIEGALGWNWQTQLCDTVRRDVIGREDLEALLSSSGIGNDTTIVLYGDNNNWFSTWAFWQLKLYGHDDVRIMDGGRKKWIAEGRPLSQAVPDVAQAQYSAPKIDLEARAFLSQVQQLISRDGGFGLVDVRSADEFTGKILAPPGLPETCQRGGHIPGATNIGWGLACNEDGTFKSRPELEELYGGLGITPDKDVITYCRIGERSSHTWFVLTQLLGYPSVRNYDGSWTEWGNLVGAPIEKG
jgi:thiosulfate/3-mercaptopyruvate sulfurtransferase